MIEVLRLIERMRYCKALGSRNDQPQSRNRTVEHLEDSSRPGELKVLVLRRAVNETAAARRVKGVGSNAKGPADVKTCAQDGHRAVQSVDAYTCAAAPSTERHSPGRVAVSVEGNDGVAVLRPAHEIAVAGKPPIDIQGRHVGSIADNRHAVVDPDGCQELGRVIVCDGALAGVLHDNRGREVRVLAEVIERQNRR